jgi:hypothetical protein
MKQKKRSMGFMLAALCTFTLVLAGCRGTSPSKNSTSQTTSRLTEQQSPTVAVTAAPVGGKVYVGQVPNQNAWIGITTDGTNSEAFVTDGSQSHPATFAQWFKGPVTNNAIDTTARNKAGNDHLQAMLTDSTASGTVTLAGGQSIAFTANALPSSMGSATPSATVTPTPAATGTPGTGVAPGLYKGTGSANGDNYTAGWVVMPNAASSNGTATPSATTTPSATETATSTTTATPSATETTTPSATGTASPSATTGQQGGGVLDTKNYTVTTAPELTTQDISNGTISIQNLGTFKLVPCQANIC